MKNALENILEDITRLCWSIVYIYKNSFMGFRIYSGRTSRLEFWLFQLVYGLLLCLLVAANDLLLYFTLVATGLILPSLVACHVRRLHDVEHSGWFLAPKFLYVPWFIYAMRELWQYSTALDDYFFQAAAASALPTEQFIILSMVYCGLLYEIILLISYCQRGTAGNNSYGQDSIIELQSNIKKYIIEQEKKSSQNQKKSKNKK